MKPEDYIYSVTRLLQAQKLLKEASRLRAGWKFDQRLTLSLLVIGLFPGFAMVNFAAFLVLGVWAFSLYRHQQIMNSIDTIAQEVKAIHHATE